MNGANGMNGLNGMNGTNGTSGATALVKQTPEPAGANCANGGTRIDSGTDANANGVLDATEITATSYACNGATGAQGPAGPQGPAGSTGNGSVNPGPPSVSAGSTVTCAVMADGSARCWGDDAEGDLGDGRQTQSALPVTVSGLVGTVDIEAGIGETCAVTTGGVAWCWGANDQGQLGDNQAEPFSLVPVPVSGLGSGVASIAAGKQFVCALRTDGTVWCWGLNIVGSLGNGTNDNSPRSGPGRWAHRRGVAVGRASARLCGPHRRHGALLGPEPLGRARRRDDQ